MTSTPSVLVIGSINQDITVRVQRFPLPGETVLGANVTYGLGGKGANQAVAAARTGVGTSLLASVGDDAAGRQLIEWLEQRGVDTSAVATVALPTGTAHIVVDATGENQIVVVPGANALTTATNETLIASASIVVLQGEVPAATIERAVALAQRSGVRVLLNLAPMLALTPETLAAVDFLVVNESEAGLLLGQPLTGTADNALAATSALTAISANAVITLGAAGAVWADAGGATGRIEAPEVPVVDTTGAGDAFVGAMAAALATGADVVSAASDGIRAGTLAVQRLGATSA